MSASIPFSPAPFEPSPWLRDAHLQTILAEKLPRPMGRRHEAWRRARREHLFTLSDGDRLKGHVHLQPGDPDRRRPVVLHLHGLEASVDAPYQRGLSAKAFAAGFHSVNLNYRNCGDTEQLARGGYHSGATEHGVEVLRALHDEWGFRTLYVTGISLGANLVLKMLVDAGDEPPRGLAGAAVVSPPIDLAAGGRGLAEPSNLIYAMYFLLSLKRKMRRKLRLSPGGEELAERVRGLWRIWTLREFDERFTAPMGGFRDAADYYDRASAGPGLDRIRVPTLLVHAQDDPFLPYGMYAERMEAIARNPYLTTYFPEYGGHVGFLSRPGAALRCPPPTQ